MRIKLMKDLNLSLVYRGVVMGEVNASKEISVTVDMLTFFGNTGNIATSIKFDDGQVAPGSSYEFSPVSGGKIPVEQAYDYLMTLDEFKDGVLVDS